MIRHSLLLVIACCALLFCQTPNTIPAYEAADAFTASAGEALTIQLGANSLRGVAGQYISGSVSAAATICFSWNGSAASATANAIVVLPGFPATVATAWHTSNASGGSAGPCWGLPVGTFSFGWRQFYLSKKQTSPNPWGLSPWTSIQNFTVTITPATGTVDGNLNATWNEQ